MSKKHDKNEKKAAFPPVTPQPPPVGTNPPPVPPRRLVFPVPGRFGFFQIAVFLAVAGTAAAVVVNDDDNKAGAEDLVVAGEDLPRLSLLANDNLSIDSDEVADGGFSDETELEGRTVVARVEKDTVITEDDLLPLEPEIEDPAFVRVQGDPAPAKAGEFVTVLGLDRKGARVVADVAYVVEVQDDSVDLIVCGDKLEDVLSYQTEGKAIRLAWRAAD